MTTKTKIILLACAGVLLLLLGGISGWLLTKNYYKPTPPAPGQQSSVVIKEGVPGSIAVFNELFYNDYFTAEIKSTGQSQAIYTVQRPDRWREHRKNHFAGFGIMIGLVNSDFLYGGWVSYRYRVINDFSIITEFHLIMNQQYKYDAGLKFGVEFGVK